jgi:thymidylate synthase (FAD)
MSVKLISHSKGTDNEMNLQDLVAYSARVSNPTNQNNIETNERLIKYLIRNHHWSPLEMVSICLEINATRDICRQILRHRSFSFQEFSQRYAEASLGFVYKEARLQDTKNRQNSIEIDNNNLKDAWEQKQNELANKAQEVYKWALDEGIAKEQARAVLPEGITMSRMYMSGNLRSWVHYLQLRTGNGTQKEHQEIADMCVIEIAKVFPMITDLVKFSNEKI